MRIGIVSDTHGHVQNARRAAGILETQKIELVIHCGDIGSVEVVPLFDRWVTHFVFGNVDYDEARLRAAIEAAGHVCHGQFGELELAGVRIAFLHGHDLPGLESAIASGSYRLVCHGHTHRKDCYQIGDTTVMNPGALYRANPHSLAVAELPAVEITHIDL